MLASIFVWIKSITVDDLTAALFTLHKEQVIQYLFHSTLSPV